MFSVAAIAFFRINADAALGQDISSLLIANARNEFLASESYQHRATTSEETNKIMQRIILTIAKITSDKSVTKVTLHYK